MSSKNNQPQKKTTMKPEATMEQMVSSQITPQTLKDLVIDCLFKVASGKGSKSVALDLQIVIQNQPGSQVIHISGLNDPEFFPAHALYETVRGLAQGIDENGAKGIENAMKDLEEFVFRLESATVEHNPKNEALKSTSYLDIKFQRISVPSQRDRDSEKSIQLFSQDMLKNDPTIQRLFNRMQAPPNPKPQTQALTQQRQSSEASAPTEELSPGRPNFAALSKIEEESVGGEKPKTSKPAPTVHKPSTDNNNELSESVRVCSPTRYALSQNDQQMLGLGLFQARNSVTTGIKRALQLFHESIFLKPLSTQASGGETNTVSQAVDTPPQNNEGEAKQAADATGLFSGLKSYKARVVELENYRLKSTEEVVKTFMAGETDFQEDVQNMAGVLLENTVRHLEARCKEHEDVRLAIKSAKEEYERLCKEKDRKVEQISELEKKNEKLVAKCTFTQDAIVKFEEELTCENGAVVDLKAKYRSKKAETEKIQTHFDNMKRFVKGVLGTMEELDKDTARDMLEETSHQSRQADYHRQKRSNRAKSSSLDSREDYAPRRDRERDRERDRSRDRSRSRERDRSRDRDRKGYRVEEYSVRHSSRHANANMEKALEMLKHHKSHYDNRREGKEYSQKVRSRDEQVYSTKPHQ